MSDETTLAEAPAAAVETTPAPETVADPTTKIEDSQPEQAEAPAPKPETEVVEGEETDGEPKKRVPGSQRLKRRLELIESDYLAQQQELEAFRRRESERATPKTDGRPGVDREPTEADFPNDWFAYQDAKTAWTVRQATRDEINRAREEQRRASSEHVQTERQRERLENYHEYAAEVRERIQDFDKVVAAASVQIKDELRDELLSSEKSALLQYHLAKNPDKVKELNNLSGRELAREIGRLEARVHLPTAKRATEATPPPSQVRGAAAPPVDAQTGPDDMNAYVAWRRKQAKG